MITTIMSNILTSTSIIGAVCVSLIILLSVKRCAEVDKRIRLRTLGRYIGVFSIPIILAFCFIFIVDIFRMR
jgi:hypothetical protein